MSFFLRKMLKKRQIFTRAHTIIHTHAGIHPHSCTRTRLKQFSLLTHKKTQRAGHHKRQWTIADIKSCRHQKQSLKHTSTSLSCQAPPLKLRYSALSIELH